MRMSFSNHIVTVVAAGELCICPGFVNAVTLIPNGVAKTEIESWPSAGGKPIINVPCGSLHRRTMLNASGGTTQSLIRLPSTVRVSLAWDDVQYNSPYQVRALGAPASRDISVGGNTGQA